VKKHKHQLRKQNYSHHSQTSQIPEGGVTVSLCMIVKNEAERLGDCLRDVRAAVDEMIVVDTGSEDATQTVATGLGAKVFDFPWCNDFSAARNASLQHATGDYVLWLDADDRLDADEADKLRRLKARLPASRNMPIILLSATKPRGAATFTSPNCGCFRAFRKPALNGASTNKSLAPSWKPESSRLKRISPCAT